MIAEIKMNKRRKILLVGAGSAMFTQGLLADMILCPDMGPLGVGVGRHCPRGSGAGGTAHPADELLEAHRQDLPNSYPGE
jgi:hypothetical protein